MGTEFGTATVRLAVRVSSVQGAEHLIKHFSPRGRVTGRVWAYDASYTRTDSHWYTVIIKYKNTCINKGDTRSNALRFVRVAMKRTSCRLGEIIVESSSWEPGDPRVLARN